MRGLGMRVCRHQCGDVGFCQVQQGVSRVGNAGGAAEQFAANAHAIESQIDIIAAARGVHPTGNVRAYIGGKQIFDIEEQILASAIVSGGLDLLQVKAVQSPQAGLRILAGENVLTLQHDRVGIMNLQQAREEIALRIFLEAATAASSRVELEVTNPSSLKNGVDPSR